MINRGFLQLWVTGVLWGLSGDVRAFTALALGISFPSGGRKTVWPPGLCSFLSVSPSNIQGPKFNRKGEATQASAQAGMMLSFPLQAHYTLLLEDSVSVY